ncbi:MAG: hypothetical protein LBB77_02795, partial [Treponema sp.]|nr:hypothetical protein [Treponema sp.]
LKEKDGKIELVNIEDVPRSLDNYINDRFGFRNTIVSLVNNFNRSSKKIIGQVIVGKNEWLFFSKPDNGNNIGDFFKANLFTDAEMKSFVENIRQRFEWCNKNNIEFIFLIAPNKHNVYPEYYPFIRPNGITRTEQIIAALPAELKDTVIYPLDYIIMNKTNSEIPLYFETDTHWNTAGAYYAFQILSGRFKQLFPGVDFQEIQFITDVSYDSSGDIGNMLNLAGYWKRTIPDMRPAAGWGAYYQYIKNEGTNGIITKNNDQSLPKAIIFRDSFFVALEPFVSTQFSSVEYNWREFNESDTNYILENKPDIIIWEVVERGISDIPYLTWK